VRDDKGIGMTERERLLADEEKYRGAPVERMSASEEQAVREANAAVLRRLEHRRRRRELAVDRLIATVPKLIGEPPFSSVVARVKGGRTAARLRRLERERQAVLDALVHQIDALAVARNVVDGGAERRQRKLMRSLLTLAQRADEQYWLARALVRRDSAKDRRSSSKMRRQYVRD